MMRHLRYPPGLRQCFRQPVFCAFGVLLCCITLLASGAALCQPAPSVPVSGQVTGPDGAPLAGVTIHEKGSQRGTLTDENGRFALEVSSPGAVLEVSYLGYSSREVAAGQAAHIVLEAGTRLLDSLVVVGYGTQKKGDVTGAIASISGEDIASVPVADAGQAIEGKAAGIQVVSSGNPGSNVTIRVRGLGTINNSDPLVVIDGVPTDVPLNMLNPDDIASVAVLKDASAAAIYGSRGANGVVMITTRKGGGAGRVTFNAYAGVQRAASLVKMLNAREFAMLNNEMLQNNNQPVYQGYADPDALGAGTDWMDLMFRSAPMQHYSLSYSGGGDKSSYYVSASYLNQQGIVIHTAYKRYTVQFNANDRVLRWLTFGNHLTLSHDEKPSGAYDIRSAMAANPALPLYNDDGIYAGPEGQAQWVGDVTNPVAKATLVENNTKGYNILGSLFAEATLYKGLTFRTAGGLQAQFWDSRTWSPAYDYAPIPQPSSYLSEQYNKNLTLNWDNYLTYKTSFAGTQHLTVVAGTNAQSSRYDYISGNITGFASTETRQLTNGSTQAGVDGSASEWSIASYYARLTYDYGGRYLLTATVRRDGSSRFGENHKWGTFPSASLAWRISEEPFFRPVHFVDHLKLRVGYGVTGNQQISNYSFASTLSSAVYVFNNHTVAAELPLMMANPDVQWESVSQANIGLDLSVLDQRLSMTVDAYLKHTSKMLVPMPVPIPTGYSDIVVPYINTGKVENKGIEISASSRNLTGAVKWTTDVNVSFNKNKLKALYDQTPLYIGSAIGLNGTVATNRVGYPINAFYGYVMQGIFQSDDEVAGAAVQVPGADSYNRTSAGDVRFRDLNNDGVINDGDRTIIGSPNPLVIYGMTNSFSYRGFDASIFLQGVQGNDILNANNVFQQSMSVAQNQTTAVLGRWEGAGTSDKIPRAIFNDPNQNARISSRFLEDGSYLRIKNITLGYTLPSLLVSRYRIHQIRCYASVENLITFTRYSGIDPEVPASGVDYSVYPVTRTVSAGINITL